MHLAAVTSAAVCLSLPTSASSFVSIWADNFSAISFLDATSFGSGLRTAYLFRTWAVLVSQRPANSHLLICAARESRGAANVEASITSMSYLMLQPDLALPCFQRFCKCFAAGD